MTEWFESDESWYPAKWGPDDQLGTLNVLGPDSVLAAARLIRHGHVYRLGHEIFHGMPTKDDAHGPFGYFVTTRPHDDRGAERSASRNKFGATHCRLEMVDHLGTHIDALNHIAFDNRFYNGVDAYAEITAEGVRKLGMETFPPIVTRGVLVDVAGLHGVDVLDRGYAITVDDVESCLAGDGLDVRPGDVVVFHTGVSASWDDPGRRDGYFDSPPGIGYAVGKWLAERDVAAVGADSPATEVMPSELPDTYLPVHQYLIVKHGIRILDNLKLDELAAARAHEFAFVCAPLPLRGATGSPVNPL
ncbi:MAG: cyclase family protein, partial [Actinomycetia bacterium]|nr:cyclase family protein [Actinomycetes bacterium]